MRDEPLTYADLVRIVELIKSTEAYTEVHLKLGGIEIDLRKLAAPGPAPHAGPATAGSAAAARTTALPGAPPKRLPPTNSHDGPAARPVRIAEGMAVVKAPMVGTFYRSPEPGAAPFVEVGQVVAADRTVCIIEVMKLMNSIPAGSAGRVKDILVHDSDMVEMGQPLIVIDLKG